MIQNWETIFKAFTANQEKSENNPTKAKTELEQEIP